MAAFVLILAFPLLVGLCFGLLHLAGPALGLNPARIRKKGLFVYVGLLVVPLLVAAWAYPAAGLSLATLGWSVPTAPGLDVVPGPTWAVLASIFASAVAGIGVGWLGYRGEKWFVGGTDAGDVRTAGPTHQKTDLQYLTDGQLQGDPQAPRRADVEKARKEKGAGALLMVGITLFAVLAEESLWRGYLITYAESGVGLHEGWALLLSAGAFGSNHAQFGWRNVVSKFGLGLAWGGLFLLTGSLLAPILSHLTFNLLALEVAVRLG